MGRNSNIFALTFLAVLIFSRLSASHNPGTGRVSLPPPTGHNPIGTIEFKLTDKSHTDALAPDPFTPRSFMVQIFYPTTRQKQTAKQAPYMRRIPRTLPQLPHPQPLVHPNQHLQQPPISLPDNTTHTILFSPGFQYSRIFYTSLAEKLASQGYIDLALDHTYDATAVQFPNSTITPSIFLNITNPPAQITRAYTRDPRRVHRRR